MGRRVGTYAAALVLTLVSVTPAQVLGQSTSDLYAKYGVADNTAYRLQERKLDDLMDDYNAKSEEYNYAVEYNDVIARLDLDKLQGEAINLERDIDNKKESILNTGIDMSYQELRESMSDYKSAVASLSDKKALIEKYSDKSPIEVPNYDFDTLAQELTYEQEVLDALREDAEIGDIDNLYNFLQASYTVKRKFDGAGLLLKALPDTGVLSVFNGTVIYSERNEVTGETIKIDSGDGIIITYCNLTARYVQTDDAVIQYQKIATTGENLYITLEINGEYYDLNELYGG